MNDDINAHLKRLAILQEQRTKEIKRAVYPFENRLPGRTSQKSEEQIKFEVATINKKYDAITQRAREELNIELEHQGYNPYKKENDKNAYIK